MKVIFLIKVSSSKGIEINEKKYERTANVWKVFKIKNLGEYHDLNKMYCC